MAKTEANNLKDDSSKSLITPNVDTKPVTLRRVVSSEWIKFKTLRSSWAVLLGAVVAMIIIGLLVAFNTRHLSSKLQADDIGRSGTLQGNYLAQLLIGALGVLFVSSEFTSGQIRSTFTAVPKRQNVLLGKLIVFLSVTLIVLIPTCIVTFLAAQGFISHYRIGYSLGDSTAIRVVLGTGVYLPLIGIFGGAIAWIVRSTAGSLVTFFALLLVLPVIFDGLFGSFGKHIYKFLPSGAGSAFISSPAEPGTLKPILGLIVLLIWIIAAYSVALINLKRRDA